MYLSTGGCSPSLIRKGCSRGPPFSVGPLSRQFSFFQVRCSGDGETLSHHIENRYLVSGWPVEGEERDLRPWLQGTHQIDKAVYPLDRLVVDRHDPIPQLKARSCQAPFGDEFKPFPAYLFW